MLEGFGSQSLGIEVGDEDGAGTEVESGVEDGLGQECGGTEGARVKASSSMLETKEVKLTERWTKVLIRRLHGRDPKSDASRSECWRGGTWVVDLEGLEARFVRFELFLPRVRTMVLDFERDDSEFGGERGRLGASLTLD